MNDQIAHRLKSAAATPVVDGNVMPRRIAIDEAIAWCKREFPDHFNGDDYGPPSRIAQRCGTPEVEVDGP